MAVRGSHRRSVKPFRAAVTSPASRIAAAPSRPESPNGRERVAGADVDDEPRDRSGGGPLRAAHTLIVMSWQGSSLSLNR
jgi:uncharacterized membrane protein